MDPVRNPYTPGAGSTPLELVGRANELDAFDVAVQRMGQGRHAKSFLLTGLRGVGKTVLLREFGHIAAHHGWVHRHIEATSDLDFPDVMAMLVRKAVLRLSVGERFTDRGNRMLGVLKSFQLRWKIPDGGDLSLGIDPVRGFADSGILDDDLAELFIELGNLAKHHGTGVLFTIDEIQYLHKSHLAALIVGIHRASQEQVPFMVAAAGLPSMPALAGEAKSYAERLFAFVRIDSFSDDDAVQALCKPAAIEGVTWSPSAVNDIVEVAAGYPYFLQEFGKQAWDVAEGLEEIGQADAQAAIPLAVDELDTGFFRVRIDRTSRREREYLVAMASLGSGPYASGAIAHEMDKSTTQAGPIRDSLIRRGLCFSPRHGIVDFTVPLFDRFLRRHSNELLAQDDA